MVLSGALRLQAKRKLQHRVSFTLLGRRARYKTDREEVRDILLGLIKQDVWSQVLGELVLSFAPQPYTLSPSYLEIMLKDGLIYSLCPHEIRSSSSSSSSPVG